MHSTPPPNGRRCSNMLAGCSNMSALLFAPHEDLSTTPAALSDRHIAAAAAAAAAAPAAATAAAAEIAEARHEYRRVLDEHAAIRLQVADEELRMRVAAADEERRLRVAAADEERRRSSDQSLLSRLTAMQRGAIDVTRVGSHCVYKVQHRHRKVYVKYGAGADAPDVRHGHWMLEEMHRRSPLNFPAPGRTWEEPQYRAVFSEAHEVPDRFVSAYQLIAKRPRARAEFLRTHLATLDALNTRHGFVHRDLHGDNIRVDGLAIMYIDLESSDHAWSAVHWPSTCDFGTDDFLEEYRDAFPAAPPVTQAQADRVYDRFRLVFMKQMWPAFDEVLGLRRDRTRTAYTALQSVACDRAVENGSLAACMWLGLLHDAGMLATVTGGGCGRRRPRRSGRLAQRRGERLAQRRGEGTDGGCAEGCAEGCADGGADGCTGSSETAILSARPTPDRVAEALRSD